MPPGFANRKTKKQSQEENALEICRPENGLVDTSGEGWDELSVALSYTHCVVNHSVVSDPLRPPGTVACQAPLSMGIHQARIVEWVAMPSSRGSSRPRDGTQVCRMAGGFFANSATSEAHILSTMCEQTARGKLCIPHGAQLGDL